MSLYPTSSLPPTPAPSPPPTPTAPREPRAEYQNSNQYLHIPTDDHSLSLSLSSFSSLPPHSPLRTHFLNDLLSHLSPAELSLLGSTIQASPRLKRDFLSHLPFELGVAIAHRLPMKDIVTASAVSKAWLGVMRDEGVWRGVVEEDTMARWRMRAVWNRTDEWSYRAHFERSYVIAKEWGRRGGGKVIYAYNSPDNAIITSLALSSQHTIIALNNPHIHVFSTSTGKLQRTLSVPSTAREGVWAVNLLLPSTSSSSAYATPGQNAYTYKGTGIDESKILLVTGGCEKVLRVWDVSSGRCVHTLHGHRSTIRCLVTLVRGDGNEVRTVSGGRDGTVRVWDPIEGRLVRTMSGHMGPVRCLASGGEGVVGSGSYDRTIKIWNTTTGECLHTLAGHTQNIYALAFSPCGRWVASGGLDTRVRVWGVSSGQCLAILSAHTALVSMLKFLDGKLVSAGADGKIVVFTTSPPSPTIISASQEQREDEATTTDEHQLQHEEDSDQEVEDQLILTHSKTHTAHTSAVSSLILEEGFPYMISGGDDGDVHIFSLTPPSAPDRRKLSSNTRMSRVWEVALSPDGSRMVVCGMRGNVSWVEVWGF